MSCLFPQKILLPNGIYQDVSCGKCLNCLTVRQSQLEFLCRKELIDCYQSGRGASFVTLTYTDLDLPYVNSKNEIVSSSDVLNGISDGFQTLYKPDLQKFLKRFRKHMELNNDSTPFKYIACGEYGDSLGRPHYHIVFLGLTDVQVNQYSKKAWKNGLIDIGPLTQGGIRYVLKYITKSKPSKDVKELRDSFNVQNPFITHSIGLGKNWIQNNLKNILDSDYTFSLNGKINLFPSYVIKYVAYSLGDSNYKQTVSNFYLNKPDFKLWSKTHLGSFRDFSMEKSYLDYKQKVAALRSKNIPVNDETLSKAYIRPKTKKINVITSNDKKIFNLAIKALEA